MQFVIKRDLLLHPLQAVQGVVERRQTLPILTNVLLSCHDETLSVSATDMELELVATIPLTSAESGQVTVPARKLVDICRSLSADANVKLSLDNERVVLQSGRSRFVLGTLPAGDFPSFDKPVVEMSVTLQQADLKKLIDLTHFAMAQQDVRYYLNGLLFEFSGKKLRTVATDGTAWLSRTLRSMQQYRNLAPSSCREKESWNLVDYSAQGINQSKSR